MKLKRNIIVLILIVSFSMLSAVAAIAIIYSMSQQTIKTTLNIKYTAVDIDGSVTATYTIGNETNNLTAMKGDNVIGSTLWFKATDTENAGNFVFPENQISLDSSNDNMILKYTFTNNGDADYTAIMSFDDTRIDADNMLIEYSLNGRDYYESRLGLVVTKAAPKSYWIKISIQDKSKNASLLGDFDWLLERYEAAEGEEIIAMDSLIFIGNEESESYEVCYNGKPLDEGKLVIPASVGSAKVSSIVHNENLTETQISQVSSLVIEEGVKVVDEEAFDSYLSLTEITIPESLTTMNWRAFRNCDSLEKVNVTSLEKWVNIDFYVGNSNPLYNGASLYLNGTLLTDVSLTGINKIKSNAFIRCPSIVSVTMDDNVAEIGDSVFQECENLTSVVMSENLTSIGTAAFKECVLLNSIYIPKGIISLKDYSFYNCCSATSLTFAADSELTNIGTYVFSKCSSIESVDLPSKLTIIGNHAFNGCSGAKTIIIPKSVTTFGSRTFYDTLSVEKLTLNCSSITNASLQDCFLNMGTNAETCVVEIDNLTNVPDRIFNGCTGITKLTIPWSVTSIGNYAFQNCVNLTEINYEASNVTNAFSLSTAPFVNAGNNAESCIVNIATCVKKISSYLFVKSGITEVYLLDRNDAGFAGSSLVEIPTYTFGYCTKLEMFSAPYYSVLEKIGKAAFVGCSNLQVFGGRASEIGEYAFQNCTSLTTASFRMDDVNDEMAGGPAFIGAYAFHNCTALVNLDVYDFGVQQNGKMFYWTIAVVGGTYTPWLGDEGTMLTRLTQTHVSYNWQRALTSSY